MTPRFRSSWSSTTSTFDYRLNEPCVNSYTARKRSYLARPVLQLDGVPDRCSATVLGQILVSCREVGERAKIIVAQQHEMPDGPSECPIHHVASLSRASKP